MSLRDTARAMSRESKRRLIGTVIAVLVIVLMTVIVVLALHEIDRLSGY